MSPEVYLPTQDDDLKALLFEDLKEYLGSLDSRAQRLSWRHRDFQVSLRIDLGASNVVAWKVI